MFLHPINKRLISAQMIDSLVREVAVGDEFQGQDESGKLWGFSEYLPGREGLLRF